MSSLEEEFQASEQARAQAEEKKRMQQAGVPIPGSPQETLEKFDDLKVWLNSISLEKEAHQRISAFLVQMEEQINAKRELKEFSGELAGLADMLNQILTNSQSARDNVDKLSSALLADLEARKELRKKQHETLGMLNQYLRNWL